MSVAMSNCNLTAYLANRALYTGRAKLPEDVLTIAQHCLLDWFSLTLTSWSTPVVGKLTQYYEQEIGAMIGGSTALGTGALLQPHTAMMLNGTAGHALDFDDTHLKSRVHPSVPLWPAILMHAEQGQISGERMLAAFVAGVEVQSRLAAVMGDSHYSEGWHNTATLGTFGAAAAVGILLDLDEQQMSHALGIAATMAGGLRAVFGTPAKPLQVARASANGSFAAGLARTGFQADLNIMDGEQGFPALYAKEIFLDLAQQAPNHWCVRDIIFKYHASCYGTQAPIESALRFTDLDRKNLSSIRIYIEPQYIDVCNIQSPITADEAKFSIRHMVAMVLAGKDTGVQTSFDVSDLREGEVSAWRELIQVYPDPEMPRANARIEVNFYSGECQHHHIDASKPEQDLENQMARLVNKSATLLEEASFCSDSIQWLQDQLLKMQDCPNVGQWTSDYRNWLMKARPFNELHNNL